MLNVLQVCPATNIGGAGKCILTYLENFNREKINTAGVLPKNSLLKPMVEKRGIKVFEIDGMADKSLDISSIKKLIKVYKDFKPHIVHTHASMAARIAAKLYGAKIVYTRHSVFPPNPKLTKGLGKLVCGFVNNLTATKIIAVAEAAKENVVAIGVDEKKIQVVLNGVNPLRKYSAEEIAAYKEQLGINADTKCVSIVARLNEVKGHKYFVEAAKNIRDMGIDAKFLIAGTGDEEKAIKEQISALGLEDTVLMLGFLTDVEPLMNITDVQVNCSFGTEATSLSLLEGMSLGKPAVVSDFGGNPGVIKPDVNGYLFPTHNVKEPTQNLPRLLQDDDLYHRLSEGSLKVFESTFTAKTYGANIDNIYFTLGGKNNE